MQIQDRKSVICIWLYGKTGTGKSTFSHEVMPDAYVKDPTNVWWDGYTQEKDVIFEDFGQDHPPVQNLLHWCSRFKCRIQTKGGHTALSARRFIVTSNFSIDAIFTTQTEAVKRRFIECNVEQGLIQIREKLRDFDASDIFEDNIRDNPLSVNSNSSIWEDISTSLSDNESVTNVMAIPE